jgi:hypothetical protein
MTHHARTYLVSDGIDEIVDFGVGVNDQRLDAAVPQEQVDLCHARLLRLYALFFDLLVRRHAPVLLRLLFLHFLLHLRQRLLDLGLPRLVEAVSVSLGEARLQRVGGNEESTLGEVGLLDSAC